MPLPRTPRTNDRRLPKACAIAVVAILISAAPAASARPVSNPACEDSTYSQRHPLICDSNHGPFDINGGGGGGTPSGGGLLGTIRRIIGSIL